MVPLAPRYDARILDLIRLLDDRGVPIAEVCRRIGAAAAQMGLFKPSYVHLRRLIHAERNRREAVREVVADVADRLLAGRYVDGYELPIRLVDAGARSPKEWLVAQSHKVLGVDGARRPSRRPGAT